MTTTLQSGAGGLPKLALAHPTGASAELYLHGAHLTSWVPAGSTEALFLSRAARFEDGRAIRGGVPVIFPQFAERGPLPRHGLVRTRAWRLKARADAASATLELDESPETLHLWPHSFHAELTVELDGRRLLQRLAVRNTGELPFSFTAALHSYFRVADVREASVEGLRGVTYRDRVRSDREFVEDAPELRIRGEVDRVYLGAPESVRVHDRLPGRRLGVTKSGFADLVVWNPGLEVASAFPDMETGEHLAMLCVEVAQVADPVVLDSGGEWIGEQRVELLDA